MTKHLPDEQLGEWAKLAHSAPAHIPPTVHHPATDTFYEAAHKAVPALIQEVRRLRGYNKESLRLFNAADRRAENAEAEVERLRKERGDYLEIGKTLAAERDRFKELAGYANHDGGCPKQYVEDENSCPCGYLRYKRRALNQQGDTPSKP